MGAQYTAATGKAWFDSAGGTYQGMINQVEAAYEDPDSGDIIATDNAEVEDLYNQVLDASATQSAHLGQWSDDWFAGLSNGAYATMLCPGWMLGVISGNAEDVTDWDVANVFPNGGGNWGGSYLTVPANGAHVEEAQKLADWLTAPEQQIKAFVNAGTFPSQNDAYTDEALTGFVERVLQRRTGRPDLHGSRQGRHGRSVQGRVLLPGQRRDAEGPDPRRGRHAGQAGVVGPVGLRGRGDRLVT